MRLRTRVATGSRRRRPAARPGPPRRAPSSTPRIVEARHLDHLVDLGRREEVRRDVRDSAPRTSRTSVGIEVPRDRRVEPALQQHGRAAVRLRACSIVLEHLLDRQRVDVVADVAPACDRTRRTCSRRCTRSCSSGSSRSTYVTRFSGTLRKRTSCASCAELEQRHRGQRVQRLLARQAAARVDGARHVRGRDARGRGRGGRAVGAAGVSGVKAVLLPQRAETVETRLLVRAEAVAERARGSAPGPRPCRGRARPRRSVRRCPRGRARRPRARSRGTRPARALLAAARRARTAHTA